MLINKEIAISEDSSKIVTS